MQIIGYVRKPVRRESNFEYMTQLTPSRSMGRRNDWIDDVVTSTAHNGSYGGVSRDGVRNMIASLWHITTNTFGFRHADLQMNRDISGILTKGGPL